MKANRKKQRDKYKNQVASRGGPKAQQIRNTLAALDKYEQQIEKRLEERQK